MELKAYIEIITKEANYKTNLKFLFFPVGVLFNGVEF
jgi:hypothetical protein